MEIHVLSNLDGHQHGLNEYMGRELFVFCLVSRVSSDIIFNLVNQHYSKAVGNYIVYNKEYVYVSILFTNDQTKWTRAQITLPYWIIIKTTSPMSVDRRIKEGLTQR